MRVVVIGGGAAGLIAAGTCAKTENEVILIEKNDILGKKLLITGKGRCNITNDTDIENMISMYPVNGKSLYSALYTFTNDDIISLIESYGVKTKVERGGRVFPESDKSSDVVRALKKYALQKNTKLIKDTVKTLLIKEGRIEGVKTKTDIIKCDRVIVCTGGKSYPGTGSTGDGYKFAKLAGHTIVPLKPSLVPVNIKEDWVKQLMGLSLKNISIKAYNKNNKKVYDNFGEMMFTHFGISGPVVLSMSAHLNEDDEYSIAIDLKPALSTEQLDNRLLRDFEKYNNKHIINSLGDLLPKALIPVVINLAQIPPHKTVNTITRTQRHKLIGVIKGLTMTFEGFRPIEEAIVTSGGVKVSEINTSTMESKIVKGLYFAGEVIDIDGYTGGYNLQAAFSTGYLAGMNASV